MATEVAVAPVTIAVVVAAVPHITSTATSTHGQGGEGICSPGSAENQACYMGTPCHLPLDRWEVPLSGLSSGCSRLGLCSDFEKHLVYSFFIYIYFFFIYV